MKITRRALLKGAGALTGLGVLGGVTAWRWLGRPELADLSGWTGFTPNEVDLLNEIAESIIPATDTPGAKAANVGAFIAIAVTECFEATHQAAFVAGLRRLDVTATDAYGQGFRHLSAEQRETVMSSIERERRLREFWNRGQRGLRLVARPVVGIGPPLNQVPHYLTMMVELTMRGYFTSEIGATQALRHNPIPGDYDGALPYRKGDRSWSM